MEQTTYHFNYKEVLNSNISIIGNGNKIFGNNVIVKGSNNISYGLDNTAQGINNLGFKFNYDINGDLIERKVEKSIPFKMGNLFGYSETDNMIIENKIIEKKENKIIEVIIAEEITCKVCFDSPIKSVCIPCGHMSMCVTCSKQFIIKNKDKSKYCPICAKGITGIYETFI